MVARLGRRSSSPAPLPPMRLSCNGLNMCIDAWNVAGQGFFDNALRFDLVQPCDNSNISLTVLFRVAQWTGYFVCCFDAHAHFGASTMQTGIGGTRGDLVLMTVCYTQMLNPLY